MATHPIGRVFVELDMDVDRYTKAQRKLYKDATSTSLSIEQNFKSLGIKTSAHYDLMRQKISNAYQSIAHDARATANDLIRAEKAKNDQLAKLQNEQYGHQVSLLNKLKTNWIAVAASIYAVQQAFRPLIALFEKGFQAVEDYNQSVASMAAMVTSFAERSKGVSLQEQWQQALKYSTALVPILEKIAAKTLLSGEETTALANAFARSGVFLDAANKKQMESFTMISNALPLMTKGQEIMRQINTEIRSVMTGSNEASSMMLQTLKAMDPNIEKNLELWRQEGTVLEHIGELLVGFGPATELLENQWGAVKNALDTTVTQTLRAGMIPTYQDIVDLVKNMNSLLEDSQSQIQVGIVIALSIVSDTLKAIGGVLQGFGPTLSDLAGVLGTIAYGWGGIFAVVKVIGELIGNQIALTYELAKMLGYAATAAGELASLNYKGAIAAWEKAKESYAEVERLSIRQNDLVLNGITDAIVAYDAKVQAAKKGYNDEEAASKKWKAKTISDMSDVDKVKKKLAALEVSRQKEVFDVLYGLSDETKQQIIEQTERQLSAYKEKLEAAGIYSNDALGLAKALNEKEKELFKDNVEAFRKAEKEKLNIQIAAIREMISEEANRTSLAENAINSEEELIWQLTNEVEAAVQQSYESFIKSTEKTTTEMDKLWTKGLNRVQEGFADTFYDAMTGELDDLGDLFDSFFNDILRMVAELAAKMTMYDLFGVGTSGWAALFSGISGSSSGASGSGGGGGGMLGSLLSLGGTAYELLAGETFSQTLVGIFPSLAETLGVGVTTAMFATEAELIAVFGEEVAAQIIAMMGMEGAAVATGAGLGASLGTVAQGGLAGIVAAAWALGSQFMGEWLMKQNEGPSSFNAQGQISTSKNQGELFSLPSLIAAWVKEGEWSEEDATNAAKRFIGEMIDSLSMYEIIFQNLNEESQAALESAVDALNLSQYTISYEQMASDNAPANYMITKTDSLSDDVKKGFLDSMASVDWTEWWQESFVDRTLGQADLADITFDDERIQQLYDANKGWGQWANAMDGISDEITQIMEDTSKDFMTKNMEMAQLISDWMVAKYQAYSGETGITAAQATQEIMQGVFDAYISEALTSLSEKPIFEYMSDEIKAAFGELDLELFLSDIDKFTETFNATAAKIYKAEAIWKTLENIGAGIEYTKADTIAAMAEAWGEAYKTITEAYTGTEISDEDMAAKVKEYYAALAEGTANLDQAVEGVTELDVAVGALNGTFDAYIEQLALLGVAVEEITALEEMRLAAMNKLLEDYKHAIGLIDDETYYTAMFEKIWSKYKEYFASYDDFITKFTSATVEDIQAWLAAIGSDMDWTDVANDVGWLVKAIQSMGEAAEVTAQSFEEWKAQLLGLEDELTKSTIAGKYGLDQSKMTTDWWQSVLDAIYTMSEEQFNSWAASLGVSSDQLRADINALNAAFDAAGDSADTATSRINELADEIKSILDEVRGEISGGSTGGGFSADDLWAQYDTLSKSLYDVATGQGLGVAMQDLLSMAKLAAQWYDAKIKEAEEAARLIAEETRAGLELEREGYEAERDILQEQLEVAQAFGNLADNIYGIINSIKYSTLNISLPTQKAVAAQDDYNILKQKALASGSVEDYTRFVEFAQTYLEQSQAAYKSSGKYQEIYAQVMADLADAMANAENLSYEDQILDDLAGIDATIKSINDRIGNIKVEIPADVLAGINDTFNDMAAWIEEAMKQVQNLQMILTVDWGSYTGDVQTVLQMLADLVAVYGWEDTITLDWITHMAQWAATDVEAAITLMDKIALKSGGWSSTASITFIAALGAQFNDDNLDSAKAVLDHLVTTTGWDSDATITFVTSVASNLASSQSAMLALQHIINSGNAWDSKVTLAFLAALDPNLLGKSSAELMLDYLFGEGGWDNTAYVNLKAQLTDGSGGYLSTIEAWLTSIGITDQSLIRSLSLNIVYDMVISGDLDDKQFAQLIHNEALSAITYELAGDINKAKSILTSIEQLASMMGVNNAASVGWYVGYNLSESIYESVKEADAANLRDAYVDSWGRIQQHTEWAEGGLVTSPTLGWVGEAGYPEAVIPMKDGISIPVKWVGTPQSGDSGDIVINLQVVTEDGEIKREDVIRIARAEADHVRVSANTHPGNERRRLYR